MTSSLERQGPFAAAPSTFSLDASLLMNESCSTRDRAWVFPGHTQDGIKTSKTLLGQFPNRVDLRFLSRPYAIPKTSCR